MALLYHPHKIEQKWDGKNVGVCVCVRERDRKKGREETIEI